MKMSVSLLDEKKKAKRTKTVNFIGKFNEYLPLRKQFYLSNSTVCSALIN